MFDAIRFDNDKLGVGIPVRWVNKDGNTNKYGLIDKHTKHYIDILAVGYRPNKEKFNVKRYRIEDLKEFEIITEEAKLCKEEQSGVSVL